MFRLVILASFSLLLSGPAGADVEVGKVAPDFSLPDQSGKIHRLVDYRGKTVVLAFYPKDFTGG